MIACDYNYDGTDVTQLLQPDEEIIYYLTQVRELMDAVDRPKQVRLIDDLDEYIELISQKKFFSFFTVKYTALHPVWRSLPLPDV